MTLGDFDAGATLHFKFTTFRPSTGAPFTLAGNPAISVYKDASTTQSTSGVTLTVDFDAVTGLNHVAIDTSTDGTFYAAGSFYDVVVTTGTVDSVSAVGVVVGRFTLRKTACLKPTTAGRTLDVTEGGEAGIDWANVGSPTTPLNLSGTTISTSQAVASVSGAVGSVTGNVGGNVVGSVGSVTGNVGGVTGVTFPATVSSLTAAGVRTELSTELGRIDVATSTRLATSGYTAPLDAAGTRSALGLAAANLDTQLGDLPTAVENAAAVWNALTASYVVNGSFGERVLRSTNTQAEVAVTGNGHVASVLHSSEAGSITVGAFAANSITAAALATDAVTEIAGGVLGSTVESTETLLGSVRLMRAAMVGKLSGAATTTVTIRDAADTKNRITATVTADGNRTDVTTDAT